MVTRSVTMFIMCLLNKMIGMLLKSTHYSKIFIVVLGVHRGKISDRLNWLSWVFDEIGSAEFSAGRLT